MTSYGLRSYSVTVKKNIFLFHFADGTNMATLSENMFLLIFLRSDAETVCKVKKKNDFLLKLLGNDLIWIAIVSCKFQQKIYFFFTPPMTPTWPL